MRSRPPCAGRRAPSEDHRVGGRACSSGTGLIPSGAPFRVSADFSKPTPCASGWSGSELVREDAEVELLSERLAEQLGGIQPLSLAPQLAEPFPRFGRLEPALPESIAKRPPPRGLERPGAQIRGHVEPRVDVSEPALAGPHDAREAAQQLRVA